MTARKKPMLYAVLCLVLLGARAGLAEVIVVAPVVDGRSFAPEGTKTFLWQARDAAATLLFIPGGEGRLGLTDNKDLGGFYGSTLKPLTDPKRSSARLNVVVFDSPKELSLGVRYPDSRATPEHLMRIESVLLYYKERLNKPIWLMGHSNGAVSVTEFRKYLERQKKTDLVAGIVFSSGRNGADFDAATTDLPVLFLAHLHDSCRDSSNAASKSVFERLKQIDKAKLDYVLITGGAAHGDPCRSGYHMFYGAEDQAYRAIDSFIGGFYQ